KNVGDGIFSDTALVSFLVLMIRHGRVLTSIIRDEENQAQEAKVVGHLCLKPPNAFNIFVSVSLFEDCHILLVTPDLAEHPLQVVHLVQGDRGGLHLVLATVLEGASDLFRGAGVLAKRKGSFRGLRK